MYALLKHHHIPGCRSGFSVVALYDDEEQAQKKARKMRENQEKHSCITQIEVRDIGQVFQIPNISFSSISGVKGNRIATNLKAELQHWI